VTDEGVAQLLNHPSRVAALLVDRMRLELSADRDAAWFPPRPPS
jgi:hypothetical protein